MQMELEVLTQLITKLAIEHSPSQIRPPSLSSVYHDMLKSISFSSKCPFYQRFLLVFPV